MMNKVATSSQWKTESDKLVEQIVHYFNRFQKQAQLVSIDLERVEPSAEDHTSVWVDGGSHVANVIGGTIFIVQAFAGFFEPGSPIAWEHMFRYGFTTLPRDAARYAGLYRDMLEIECAAALMSHNPDFVVLDNSLTSYATMDVPHSVLRYFVTPRQENTPEYEFFKTYVEFVRRFDGLIKEAINNDIVLVGASKDPRSRSYATALGFGRGFNDSSVIALLAAGRVGFTKPEDAPYLEEPRVKRFLEKNDILTEGRGSFCKMFGILKPHANPFRVDFLRSQFHHCDSIRQFLTAAHDGNGYFTYSHVVHKRASLREEEAKQRLELIRSRVAKESVHAAHYLLGPQRRERFG